MTESVFLSASLASSTICMGVPLDEYLKGHKTSDYSNVLRNTEDIHVITKSKSQKRISNLKKDHQYHEYDPDSHCTSIVEHQRLAQRGCQHHHNYSQYQKYYTIQVKLCTTKENNTNCFSYERGKQKGNP